MSNSWKPLQDLRKPPKLLLHNLHRKDDNGSMKPLFCEAMLNVFCPTGAEPKAATERPPGLDDVSIRIEDRQIIIAPDTGAASNLTLLFAEVRLGQDVQSGFPLIVVAGTEGGTIWLLLVEGNDVAGKRALSMLGEAGAIRSDFSKGFTLHPRPLGSGSNAAVYKVNTKCPAGEGVEELVAKIGFVQNDGQNASSAQQQEAIPRDVRLEVEMLSMVQRHPNIVGFHGLFRYVERVEDAEPDQPQHVTRWILTLQFCTQGDLFSIVSKAPMPEAKTREVASGLLNALAHVHKLGIVHRDVKPENMLLTGDGRALLADFGISCHISDYQQMQRRCGSPSYAAPEILGGKAYGSKVDCFSAGSLTFFIVSGKLPFDGPNIASMLRRTERCQVDFEVSPIFRSVSDRCKAFILSLLVRSPDERPTAEEALRHEWIQGDAERVPERRRKSNTAAPSDSQRVAALALAGVTLTGEPSRPPSTEVPAPIPLRSTSAAPARGQASGSQGAGSPQPPPIRRDRLGSLTGPAAAAAAAPAPATRPAPARRFFNLPKVFKKAKKEGDSITRDDEPLEARSSMSAKSEVSGSGSDDSDEESHGSRPSFDNARGADAARADGTGSRTTRSSLGRRFRRIVSPRGATPGAASSSSAGPAPAPPGSASASTSLFASGRSDRTSTANARSSNSPPPPTPLTPVRTGNRSRTVDPGAVRLASARSSVANAAAAAAAASTAPRTGNNNNQPQPQPPQQPLQPQQPPPRRQQRTSTTDSASSRSYAARLGSLAHQLASRVGMSSNDNPGDSPEAPEADQDEERDDDFKTMPASQHTAPQYPVPPTAPPPMKGQRRQPTGGRRVSMA